MNSNQLLLPDIRFRSAFRSMYEPICVLPELSGKMKHVRHEPSGAYLAGLSSTLVHA